MTLELVEFNVKQVVMKEVSSSNISKIGYDDEKHEVHIDFINGKKYFYKDVPKRELENLLSAPSIGSYINRFFKGTYECMEKPSFAALKEASALLVEYLNRHYDPHTEIIVSMSFVRVAQDLMGISIEIKD